MGHEALMFDIGLKWVAYSSTKWFDTWLKQTRLYYRCGCRETWAVYGFCVPCELHLLAYKLEHPWASGWNPNRQLVHYASLA